MLPGDGVAVSVFGPAIVLRVQDVTVAIPSTPVGVGVVGSTVPLFAPVANVTSTPGTGLPLASRTITEGREATAVPAGADWMVRLLLAIDAGWPAVSVIVPDTALAKPVASKRSGQPPAGPLIARPLNVAAPLASVVAVALLNVAPAGPEAITAVTGTSAPPAGLPAASRTWITGCWANAAPLAAVGEGSVVIVSCVAVPAPSVIVEDVAGVRPADSNRSG